jgi:hypothetical protein
MKTISQMNRSYPRAFSVLFATLVCGVCAISPRPALAYYGDCGQAESDGNAVHASDALYLLKTAVGNASYPAPLCVGDVNSSSSITTVDALMVLDKSTGQSVTLTCPSGSTCTPCTESDISSRLGALTDDERVLAATSTIFRCSQNTTITVSSGWSATVSADNVIVSARDRKLTMRRYTSGNCPGSEPGSGVQFLTITGDNVVFGTPDSVPVPTPPDTAAPWTDFTVLRFWNNVEVTGDDVTIRGVTLDSPCSTGLINKTGAVGTELRASIITRTSQKGIRTESNSMNTTSPCTDANALYQSSSNRYCYNLAVYDTLFNGAYSPFRISQTGRYLIKDSVAKTRSGWPCTDPLLENSGTIDYRVRFDGLETDDCDSGLIVAGTATAAVDLSYVHHSDKRGIWALGTSTSSLRTNDIMNNGGSSSADTHYGGVTTSGTPYVDMGTVGSPGNNVLCGNRDPSTWVQIDNDGGTIDNYGNTITNGACP